MNHTPPPAAVIRIGWMVVTSFLVESVIFGLSVLPAAAVWRMIFRWRFPSEALRILALSTTFLPLFALFAFVLMFASAAAMRLLRWRTPPDMEMEIERFGWPLLGWVRYMVSIHLVRVFAGSLFRATPMWTWYLRLNGARVGRGVYVNSLTVSDHNLIELGDHVVIGDGVHMAGHIVEHGVVKTARVRLGKRVTVGLGTWVSIGVTAGDGCQIGAMSLVPKFTVLQPDTVYAGIPVRVIEAHHADHHGAARLRQPAAKA